MSRKIVLLLKNRFIDIKGGAELQTYLLAKALSKRGHIVHFICERENKEENNENSNELKWHYIPPRSLKFGSSLLNFFILKDILDNIKPDIIYQRVRSPYTGMAAKYCKDNDCKLIYAICSDADCQKRFYSDSIYKKINFYFGWKISEYGINNSDLVIAQTSKQKMKLKRTFDIDATVIPNSLPIPNGPFKKSKPPIITWIANIKSWKRPELFIKLAQKLSDVETEFIMIGRPNSSSDYQTKLDNMIEKTPNLSYHGELPYDKVNELLRRSSVLVNTSLPKEGFPNTYIQAWMREVPVLACSFDPDDIINEHNLGCQVNNFAELLDKTKYLIDNEDERKSMGKRARTFAVRNYDINKNIERYTEAFDKLNEEG